MLQFDLPKEQSSIIKVIGVGGGGSNAVNFMYQQGIVGVNFVICNTDAQALELSPIPNKIQLGPQSTQGLGAGSEPEIGALATKESIDEIKEILAKNTKMVFITAGMGGGTGTGGAPVIAQLAKEMNILTVGIVTTPFSFEGRRKLRQAEEGIKKIKEYVDSVVIISNDKIREIYGNMTRDEAFNKADNILSTAAKSISEIITVPGQVNVDFADVKYVMQDSGVAIMGAYVAEGENRARRAVEGALSSPLLNDNDIKGAQKVLINITSGTGANQVLLDEITEINDYVQEAAGNDSDVIFGACDDDSLEAKLMVTVIATGFKEAQHRKDKQEKIVYDLERKNEKNSSSQSQSSPVEVNQNRVDKTSAQMTLFENQEIEENSISEEPRLINPTTTSDMLDLELISKPSNKKKEQSPKSDICQDDISFYTSQSREEEITSKENHQKQIMEKELEDRKTRLQRISFDITNPSNMAKLENEPAYKRKHVALDNVNHSSEQQISRYSLFDDGEARPEIRKNNAFLHDNVD